MSNPSEDRVKALTKKPRFENLPNGVDNAAKLDQTRAPKMTTALDSLRLSSLCATCKNLNLCVEKFVIGNTVSKSPAIYENSHLLEHKPASRFSPKSYSNKTILGTLRSISERSQLEHCSFCLLVIKSIQDPEQPAPAGTADATCGLTWELDGRENVDGRARGRTRRIHLTWSDKRLADSYLVYKAPETYFRTDSDARKNEALFLGRQIDVRTGRQALIKSWLQLCSNHHDGCKGPTAPDPDFCSMLEQSYFGVIDVQNWQLTTLPHNPHPRESPCIGHAPYVALSYVWGRFERGNEPYRTLLSNIIYHCEHGGLEKFISLVPQAIQDAIQLVQQLGFRYAWIDSLCIVQDSNQSWKLNARSMNLIYGNADLTICAADGNDSKTGLRALDHLSRSVYQPEGICAGVRLMVSRPPEVSIRASTWDSRAWTFQERLLSKRCLIFINGRIYFQCASTSMSEDIFADRQGAGWSLDLIHAPLLMLGELKRRALWVYMNCVSLYSARALTKPKDILAAFDGVSNHITKTMRAPFLFGLPTSHFDFALLWEPKSRVRRRKPTKEAAPEYEGLEFPSWSWCGWVGGTDACMMYKPDTVGGCLIDLREWLLRRTWIHWYVRDGQGKLRPLWHSSRSEEDQSLDERWKGYRSQVKRGNAKDGRTPSHRKR